jgi:serine/threonine-protein kinase RsbW
MPVVKEAIELKLPSKLGYEKLAMAASALIAEGMGFAPGKIEDLKTAVGEACVNAIEHGNKLHEDKRVTVLFGISRSSLVVDVLDEGDGSVFQMAQDSRIKEKIEGREPARGLGLFLIRSLMDEAEFLPRTQGTMLRMVVHLSQMGKPGA